MKPSREMCGSVVMSAVLVLGLTLRSVAEPTISLTAGITHPGRAISSDFEGLRFESAALPPRFDGIRYFRPDNLPLISLFHTLGIESLRIGGNTSDRDATRLPDEATDVTADPSNRDANKGIVDIHYQPYEPLLDAMKQINIRAYSLAAYFNGLMNGMSNGHGVENKL